MIFHFNWLDYVALAIIGLSVLTGLFRGFVKELVAITVWVIAIWLAVAYCQTVSAWIPTSIHDKTARTALAFVALLLCVLIAGGLVNALLSFILNRSGLSGTDRMLGMAFGFVRGVFIVALLLLSAKMTGLLEQEAIKKSVCYVKLMPVVDWMYGYLPNFMKSIHSIDKAPPIDITLDL
jgi:membrane protein required for colicin V production